MTILFVAIFASIPAFAQDVNDEPQTAEVEISRNSRDLEGTWDVSVTIRNCQNNFAIRTFPSVGTFMSGGTMIDSSSAIPQAMKTPGHGVWQRLTGPRYRFRFKSFSFDAGGNPTGWSIITHEANLARKGDQYDSSGIAQIYDMSGNLITTGCATTTATRFR